MIGVKLRVPVNVEPKETVAVTVIGGYWNTWYPEPIPDISTYLDLVKSLVSVAPTPTLINLKLSSSSFWIEYWTLVESPLINWLPSVVSSVEYSTTSPLLNPWFLNVSLLYWVDIPEDFILNFLCWYPEPDSITFTFFKVY